MTAFSAPSPPWRSPWSRAYVVVLWVVTWTAGLATRSAVGLTGAERREPCRPRGTTRRPRGRRPPTRERTARDTIAQRAQLLIVDPGVGDHQIEARLYRPDRADRADPRRRSCGPVAPWTQWRRRRPEPWSGRGVQGGTGEAGPEPELETDGRVVTHPAVVTAEVQGNPVG